MLNTGEISCFKRYEGHELCCTYQVWKNTHPVDSKHLLEKASDTAKSVYVPIAHTISVNGKDIKLKGGIKSLDPPCEEYASSHGDHPFTCKNCAAQYRDLKDVLRHRLKGSLSEINDRLGLRGMNKRYSRRDEVEIALEREVKRRKEVEKQVKELVKVKLSDKEWENCLMDSCLNGDEEKLVVDLIRLFKMGVSKEKPVQIMILRNLTSKLLKKNNNHYVDLVKDVSSLFKNELGSTNYALLADIFGLTGETTAANHSKENRLDTGVNQHVLDKAAYTFKGLPVNESSDGARSLRYLHPRVTNDGDVLLLGKAWDPDVKQWVHEELSIPRRNATMGDPDDYTALKRMIDELLEKDMLAKNVSIHNLTALASLEKPSLIYCIWPTRDKGYKASHLLKYWEHLRKLCFYEKSGKAREFPINLIMFSTDSAGFSLSAAVKLMTPVENEVIDGVPFLGLGIDEERFLAPYYWKFPAIAALDYDHEQRLFLKNLKYETRELHFWKQDGETTRLATIQHLQDLKNRCQQLGMDCGFNATDLLLVYFCDQNSDACERLFTPRIADLLDEHIPGSQATSLYIRAVYCLIEPFRKPNFGCPGDVQESVSCAITVFRLWRRVLELKKIPLHSKPGAKEDPSKRGSFLTYGCYTTAEILFAAATLYQLAMFLHFKDLGVAWSSPYNSGTKSTERIISELQGKTNELQSLDSQPTLADMLDKSTKVQFNVNAKKRLSQAGANVRQSAKRRQRAFSFKKHETDVTDIYNYPSSYEDFREEQKAAHYRGVAAAQGLMTLYMPAGCVELLKSSGYWNKPQTFEHPSEIDIVTSPPPESYNRLNQSYADCKDNLGNDLANDVVDECQDGVVVGTDLSDSLDDNEELLDDEVEDGSDEQNGGKWKVSKMVNGKMTYVHIKQAIKLLLPREYISRSRQKRHWASKYLPGKAPIDPNHDVVKFCNIALKSMYKGVKVYDIVRVESIQSSKDSSEITSFKSKPPSSVRLRCSLYEYSNGSYKVPSDVVLTPWKAPSAIIGAVELLPVEEEISGSYHLHPDSKKMITEMGYVLREEVQEDSTLHESLSDSILAEEELNPYPDDFYEVESIIDRRFAKDTLTYEYKARFKGFGPNDDMWLPASHFNRVINFESKSKYGRSRRHKVDPDIEPQWNQNSTAHQKRTRGKTGTRRMTTTNVSQDAKKQNEQNKKKGKKEKPKMEAKSVKVETTFGKKKLRTRKRELTKSQKALLFRSKLRTSVRCSNISLTSSIEGEMKPAVLDFTNAADVKDHSHDSDNDVPLCYTGKKCRTKSLITSDEEEEHTSDTVRENNAARPFKKIVIELSEDEATSETGDAMSLDILKGNGIFNTSRRRLAQLCIPTTNPNLTEFVMIPDIDRNLDPLKLKEIPPFHVIKKSEDALNQDIQIGGTNVVSFDHYGSLTIQGIRAIKQYYRIKEIKKDVPFEENWLLLAFASHTIADREKVQSALLDNTSNGKVFKVKCYGSNVTSQELATFCGERYLSDETITLMLKLYCARANSFDGKTSFLALPSFLTDANLAHTVVENLVKHDCTDVNFKDVKALLLPVHMTCHWGLAVFWIEEQTVRFDDGHHLPIPKHLIKVSKRILNVLHQITGIKVLQAKQWSFRRFKDPMPDQYTGPNQMHGSGSCGIGVILCARDFTLGNPFKWSYDDSIFHRAGIMLEIVNLA